MTGLHWDDDGDWDEAIETTGSIKSTDNTLHVTDEFSGVGGDGEYADHPTDLAALHDELSGEGTDEEPYQISTPYELQAIEEDPTAHYTLVQNLDMSGTTTWHDGNGFKPLPSFSGVFDGDDHIIANMHIDRPSDSDAALFTQLSTGTVENFKFTDIYIYGDSRVGSITGGRDHSPSTPSEIRNLEITGEVRAVNDQIGGLAGYLHANVTNVALDVDIVSEDTFRPSLGGICEWCDDDGSPTIDNVSVVPNIILTNDDNFDDSDAIIGRYDSSADYQFLDVYYDGTVSPVGTQVSSATALETEEMQGNSAIDNMTLFEPLIPVEDDYPEFRVVGATVEPADDADFVGGDGTYDSAPTDLQSVWDGMVRDGEGYKVVTDPYELQAIDHDPTDNYRIAENLDMSGTAQWNGGDGFAPISDFYDDGIPPFSGELDGQEHTIANLHISTTSHYTSFISEADGAVVRDLAMTGADIDGDIFTSAVCSRNTGASEFENLYVSGDIIGTDRTGGIIGSLDGTITDATSEANIVGSDSMVGGIAGQVGGDASQVESCLFSGYVESGEESVGGIIGEADCMVSGCVSTGTVEGADDNNPMVGGVVGWLVAGAIHNCYSTSTLRIPAATVNFPRSGGLAGIVEDGSVSVEDSFAAGDHQLEYTTVEGEERVGGLVGQVLYNTTDEEIPTENLYWDTNSWDVAAGVDEFGSFDSATGLTTSEMQGDSAIDTMSIVGAGIWGVDDGEYPYLTALTITPFGALTTLPKQFDAPTEPAIDVVAETAHEGSAVTVRGSPTDEEPEEHVWTGENDISWETDHEEFNVSIELYEDDELSAAHVWTDVAAGGHLSDASTVETSELPNTAVRGDGTSIAVETEGLAFKTRDGERIPMEYQAYEAEYGQPLYYETWMTQERFDDAESEDFPITTEVGLAFDVADIDLLDLDNMEAYTHSDCDIERTKILSYEVDEYSRVHVDVEVVWDCPEAEEPPDGDTEIVIPPSPDEKHTLTVDVVDGADEPLPEAEVYINNAYIGRETTLTNGEYTVTAYDESRDLAESVSIEIDGDDIHVTIIIDEDKSEPPSPDPDTPPQPPRIFLSPDGGSGGSGGGGGGGGSGGTGGGGSSPPDTWENTTHLRQSIDITGASCVPAGTTVTLNLDCTLELGETERVEVEILFDSDLLRIDDVRRHEQEPPDDDRYQFVEMDEDLDTFVIHWDAEDYEEGTWAINEVSIDNENGVLSFAVEGDEPYHFNEDVFSQNQFAELDVHVRDSAVAGQQAFLAYSNETVIHNASYVPGVESGFRSFKYLDFDHYKEGTELDGREYGGELDRGENNININNTVGAEGVRIPFGETDAVGVYSLAGRDIASVDAVFDIDSEFIEIEGVNDGDFSVDESSVEQVEVWEKVLLDEYTVDISVVDETGDDRTDEADIWLNVEGYGYVEDRLYITAGEYTLNAEIEGYGSSKTTVELDEDDISVEENIPVHIVVGEGEAAAEPRPEQFADPAEETIHGAEKKTVTRVEVAASGSVSRTPNPMFEIEFYVPTEGFEDAKSVTEKLIVPVKDERVEEVWDEEEEEWVEEEKEPTVRIFDPEGDEIPWKCNSDGWVKFSKNFRRSSGEGWEPDDHEREIPELGVAYFPLIIPFDYRLSNIDPDITEEHIEVEAESNTNPATFAEITHFESATERFPESAYVTGVVVIPKADPQRYPIHYDLFFWLTGELLDGTGMQMTNSLHVGDPTDKRFLGFDIRESGFREIRMMVRQK